MCQFGTNILQCTIYTETTGNVHGTTLTQGETYVKVLNFSTNHAIVEHFIVQPSIDVSLSLDDLLDVSSDQDELHSSAKNKHVMHIASKNDELHLLSSLHTLGYIDFDELCNLGCLIEKILRYVDVPWFSRHSYHVIDKHNK
jgi:hypothetical protein